MIGAGSIGVHSAVISGLVDFQRVERKNNRLIPACRDSWRTISSCSLFSWSADGRQDGDIEIAVGTEWTVQREDESIQTVFCVVRSPANAADGVQIMELTYQSSLLHLSCSSWSKNRVKQTLACLVRCSVSSSAVYLGSTLSTIPKCEIDNGLHRHC